MSFSRRLFPAVFAGAVSVGAASAFAAEPAVQPTTQPSVNDLRAQIDALQSKVNNLEAKEDQTQADMASTIQQVLDDADKNSKMMEVGGANAGWDPKRGFYIQSDDGNFVFHPYAQFQFRYAANYDQHGKASGSDETQAGFEVRRAKFGFNGTLFTPNLYYNFLWTTDRSTGIVSLEEAWARYKFTDALAVRAGQYKDPFAHESLVSSTKQMAAERSYAADILANGDNFIQGISIIYDNGGQIRGEAAFTDGVRSQNTNFQQFPTNPANWGIAGRAEWMVMGNNWSEYDDFTALHNNSDMLVVGLAGDNTQAGGANVFLHTLDAQYENTNGLGLYGAGIGRYTYNSHTGKSHTYDYDLLIQASYLFNPNWEVFGRYDYLYLDNSGGALGTHKNNVNELTAGVNYYFQGHAAKFTLDATYLPNGAPISDTANDILANDGHNEFVFRAQFQLLI